MVSKSAILILMSILYCALSYDFLESDDPTENIIWPTEYHFKAEKLHLTTGIKLTYEIWYSEEKNRSRIDYYDGTVKKYYYAETEDTSGALYVIHPETTEETVNKMTCDEQFQDEELHDFLPDTDGFNYERSEIYEGKEVQVWKKIEESSKMKVEEELTVFRKEQGVDIPIKHIVQSFNLWIAGLSSHIVYNYYDYRNSVASDEVDAENELDCIVFDTKQKGRNLETDLKFLHPDINSDLDAGFHSYKRHHNKEYDEDEHKMRKQIFQDNWRIVVDHNRKNLSYKLALNEFADRADEELQYLTATRPSDLQEKGTEPFPFNEDEWEALVEEIPENFDLRLEGVITPVKSQASCGCCWAFSTTAAVEGAIARTNGGRNLDLSEQSLIDCAWGFGNYGCQGGQLDGALKYVLKHGIPTELEYGTFLEQDGYCNIYNMTKTYSIWGFAQVTPGSVNAMKTALYKYGPVTVAIYAGLSMKLYSSGIFYDIDCKENIVNHGVTVVGYGVRDGVLYWIVKNSWGTNWGEDGYILMSATNNNCNLLSNAYYPIVL